MATSYSSSASHQWKYDVFISFRGADTRDNFTSYLHEALHREKIHAFIDNELKRGEEISPALLKTIEDSKVAVIIFSRNYASSPWCLDELEHIMRCKKAYGQTVLPVFYRVNPSHVQEQVGGFGAAFNRLKEQFETNQTKVESWKSALKEAANLSGWDSSVVRPEPLLIKKIVNDISKRLKKMSPIPSLDLVGIDSRIKQIEYLLCMEYPDVRFIGIWGMGGVGKTSLAKAIFSHIFLQFEGCHFFVNFKEELRKNDAVNTLQEKVLSNVPDEEFHDAGVLVVPDEEFHDAGVLSADLSFMKDLPQHEKVFLVLDDVDDSKKLREYLLGDHQRDLFCPGSRIVITSTDRHVLKDLVDDEAFVYEVSRLDDDEALQLFSLHAFKSIFPNSSYMKLSQKVVNYANGNPLALTILGSALFGRSQQEWESAIEGIQNVINPEILNLLKVSYNGLNTEQRKIFLDIACFFIGEDQNYVTKILDGCYSSARFSISVLIDKSLLTISETKIQMQDLVRDMCLGIVLEESNQPRKRTRLWNPDDISQVLATNKGSEAIEGIFLDLNRIEENQEIQLRADTFANMNHLRLLKIYDSFPDLARLSKNDHLLLLSGKPFTDRFKYVQSQTKLPYIVWERLRKRELLLPPSGLTSLPNKLSYLHWERFPSKSLPLNFHAGDLVMLCLPYSKVQQLWTGVQHLWKLRWLDLKHCRYLKRVPDLSKAENLEYINLEGCETLDELPSSVQYLRKLEYLILQGCTRLKRIPKKMESKSLQVLNLKGCSKVKQCPEVSGNLQELDLSLTAVEQLPQSIHEAQFLKVVRVAGCSNIKNFPCFPGNVRDLDLEKTKIQMVPASSIEVLKELATLSMRKCQLLVSLPSGICELKSLESLDIAGCNGIESLPANIKELPKLHRIDLSGCKKLKSLPELPQSLQVLKANDCDSLETLSISAESYFTDLNFLGCRELSAKACDGLVTDTLYNFEIMATKFRDLRQRITAVCPGSEIPQWFHYRSVGSSLTIQLPPDRNEFKGIAFCVVFGESSTFTPRWIFGRYLFRIFEFKCRIKADNCEQGDINCIWTCEVNDFKIIKEDQVLVSYHPHLEKSEGGSVNEEGWCRKYSSIEASFEFHPQRFSPLVKKFGVRLL